MSCGAALRRLASGPPAPNILEPDSCRTASAPWWCRSEGRQTPPVNAMRKRATCLSVGALLDASSMPVLRNEGTADHFCKEILPPQIGRNPGRLYGELLDRR